MKAEEVIFGLLALAWGGLLWAMRPELLKLGREGGRGLRNPRVINALIKIAGVLLPAGGLLLIFLRGF
ncbi:hypothetical protein [Candidatus Solincola tengchongensis]|uniref:hypothetical protein n=1 Tax=Candidatus Solincola tengchongensis TaxID=2900693 RepID=UPI00257DCC60|nr:hypothetical protein [Candidatus Solincola tengchongensis]